MFLFKRLISVFLVGVCFIFFPISTFGIDVGIGYDLNPYCNGSDDEATVVCGNGKLPQCFILNSDFSIESVENNIIPGCDSSQRPTCFLQSEDKITPVKKSLVDCVIKAECIADKEDRLLVSCPEGMRAKCYGLSVEPNCELENPCGKSAAVCVKENKWTANNLNP